MARCLWPVLVDIERVYLWSEKVALLLAADLPVGVYDLAVDVLHPPPRPVEQQRQRAGPKRGRPWAEAGFTNHLSLVAELRRVGYRGPVCKRMPDLWSLLTGLPGGLAGPGINGG